MRRAHLPPEARSCHTTAPADYVVEGHVPFEAVERLLAEPPAIDGIALPGMPSGSPVMPGPQAASAYGRQGPAAARPFDGRGVSLARVQRVAVVPRGY
mgnify:CR=1 FL=1